ncbi:hypothetical protein J2847_001072 [Azospirillum agricola]|uniref:hypothetical protein n=1 Tax=Azospirillum agricola TaxID=1720247 RepID=UPI001AE55240|nr:hypothetical protein [Azospirillum agricola]MBP2227790.1 hypothetical protein [Azospirillum agricola]
MADAIIQLLALACTAAGALSVYLAAPRQQWVRETWPAWPGRLVGGMALLSGGLLWSMVQHPVTALFTSLTVAMALFTALPFVAVALPVLSKRA